MSNDENAPDPLPADRVDDDTDGTWLDRLNRPRGMFTTVDREFLRGLKEYGSPQAKSERRGDIRERVTHTFYDLFYLGLLGPDLRGKVSADVGEGGPFDLRDAVANLIRFLYIHHDGDAGWLEDAVEIGVVKAIRDLEDRDVADRWGFVQVDVAIDVDEGRDLESLRQKFEEDPGSITDEELGVLVRSGTLSQSEIDQLQVSPAVVDG